MNTAISLTRANSGWSWVFFLCTARNPSTQNAGRRHISVTLLYMAFKRQSNNLKNYRYVLNHEYTLTKYETHSEP